MRIGVAAWMLALVLVAAGCVQKYSVMGKDSTVVADGATDDSGLPEVRPDQVDPDQTDVRDGRIDGTVPEDTLGDTLGDTPEAPTDTHPIDAVAQLDTPGAKDTLEVTDSRDQTSGPDTGPDPDSTDTQDTQDTSDTDAGGLPDLPPTCGNGECGDGENCHTCNLDCPVCCGDGVCTDETSCDCALDCGACGGCCSGTECVTGDQKLTCGSGGKSCLQCQGQETCQSAVCTCVPACSGKDCGPDGCGGSCGTCNDDGLFCNGKPSCNHGMGTCKDAPVLLDDDKVDCTIEVCNEDSNSFDHVPKDNLCKSTNPCTVGSCDTLIGCVETNKVNETKCSDGDPCTVDQCMDGECLPYDSNPKCCGNCVCDEYEVCPFDCNQLVCGDGVCSCAERSKRATTEPNHCPLDCAPLCGNGACEFGEMDTCALDCKGCGNGKCEPGEQDPGSRCVSDCPPVCGDHLCETGETGVEPHPAGFNYCPIDCGNACGNGSCEAGETCPLDCAVCGDGICGVLVETTATCPQDCVTPCGNGLCEGGESPDNCRIDCSWCGDSVCGLSEDPRKCPSDCMYNCGDGDCEGSESETTCPVDCAVCLPDCVDKDCGADGCGGVCGVCLNSEECQDGSCTCVPDCDGRNCGSDGCGGTCGACAGCCQEGLCRSGVEATHCGLGGGVCLDCSPQNRSCVAGACGIRCGDSFCTAPLENKVTCPTDCGPCAGGNISWEALPGGDFVFGCSAEDPDCQDSEDLGGDSRVAPFEMLATEVTIGQFQVVAGTSPSCNYNGTHGAASPVECVSHAEAQGFCLAIGGRLPTDAEWEYAARAGAATRYPCGQDLPCLGDLEWYAPNANDRKHQVGAREANALGLFDVLGNVREWTLNCHSEGGYSAQTGIFPGDPCPFPSRVVRGGSFAYSGQDYRVSARGSALEDAIDLNDLGFRCVRSDCGDGECLAADDEDCQTCPLDCFCDDGESCVDAVCTFTACDGRNCGADGFGGTCGTCDADFDCLDGVCTRCGDGTCDAEEDACTCEADCGAPCTGRVCGEDGCGHSCGNCDADKVCLDGACISCGNGSCDAGEDACTCVADCGGPCLGKTCGDDGCGSLCGDCAGAQDQCADGVCVCQPACDGKQCGDDGCGGVCGDCGQCGECQAGTCVNTKPSVYAAVPYSTRFESLLLDAHWTCGGSNQARLGINPSAGAANAGLMLDSAVAGQASTSFADLHLDLSKDATPTLYFRWKVYKEEPQPEDGVFFSADGGTSFVKAYDIASGDPGTDYGPIQAELNLATRAVELGLTLTATFVVRFQQYGVGPYPEEGISLKDVFVSNAKPFPAKLPYASFFERSVNWRSGAYPEWTTTSDANGKACLGVCDDGTGMGSLGFYTTCTVAACNYSNTADLHLDTTGLKVATDTLWFKFNLAFEAEAYNAGDGLFFSTDNGYTFNALPALTYANGPYSVNLTEQLAAKGLDFGERLILRFKESDSEDTSKNDKMLFTGIRVFKTLDTYASVPYSNSFETGQLDQYWGFDATAGSQAVVRNDGLAKVGKYSLVIPGGSLALRADLTGQAVARLGFWWRATLAATELNLMLSLDGGNNYSVMGTLLKPSLTYSYPGQWQYYVFDLIAKAKAISAEAPTHIHVMFPKGLVDDVAINTTINRASIPFFDDFESADKAKYWEYVTNAITVIDRASNGDQFSGNGYLSFENPSSLGWTNKDCSASSAKLHLTMQTEETIKLSYIWKNHSDRKISGGSASDAAEKVIIEQDGSAAGGVMHQGNSTARSGFDYSHNRIDIDLNEYIGKYQLDVTSGKYIVKWNPRIANTAVPAVWNTGSWGGFCNDGPRSIGFDKYCLDDVSVEVQQYANLPYSTDFESGEVDKYWSSRYEQAGRVQVGKTGDAFWGEMLLLMDSIKSGWLSTEDARVHLKIDPDEFHVLDFWYKMLAGAETDQTLVNASSNTANGFTAALSLPKYNTNWANVRLDLRELLNSKPAWAWTEKLVLQFKNSSSHAAPASGLALDSFKVDVLSFARPPHSYGFQTARLDGPWTYMVSSPKGRVRFTGEGGPKEGPAHVVMDSVDASESTQYLLLHLDLADLEGSPKLVFWWKEWADENDAEDGVFISSDGGLSYAKVYSLVGGDQYWQRATIDLGAEVEANPGMQLNNRFLVKFQHKGNGPLPTDGLALDWVKVYTQRPRAEAPYDTSFEAGLDPYWEANSAAGGNIVTEATNPPLDGTSHLTLDNPGGKASNAVTLFLDLAGSDSAQLRFWWKDWGEVLDFVADGVFLSDDDGKTFVKVKDLDGSTVPDNQWSLETLDLAAIADARGLSLNNSFAVRFQEAGEGAHPASGMAFDRVQVLSGPQPQAPLPFEDAFDVATPGEAWYLLPSGGGAITLAPDAADGGFALKLDCGGVGVTAASSQAWLFLDLAGYEGGDVLLRFQARETVEAPGTATVAMSLDGGATFLDLGAVDGGVTWRSYAMSLYDRVRLADVSLGSQVILRFSLAGAGGVDTNWLELDDLEVFKKPYVSPNYRTGFEAGGFDRYWGTTSGGTTPRFWFGGRSGPEGCVKTEPHSGAQHVVMDCGTPGAPNCTHGAELHLDLSNHRPVNLAFWWTDFADEYFSASDGVFLSDDAGWSFVKVLNLNPDEVGNREWTKVSLELSEVATLNGLDPTAAQFVVRIGHQGKANFEGDKADDWSNTGGIAVDDVAVLAVTRKVASLPYQTSFEGGALDQYWFVASTLLGRVYQAGTPIPHTGSKLLCLDSGGGDQTNTVSLAVNLQGVAAPVLTFWWVRWLDSCDAEDGVLFSDNGGVSYTKVASLCNGTAGAWQKVTLQVGTLAAAKGLKLNGSFVIRLQQRGSDALTKQGLCLDDLGVSN